MLQLLVFSISISIDAIGYSMGFGSRNVKLKKIEFLLINLLNILILSLFLNITSKIEFLVNSKYLDKVGIILLGVFGFIYILLALKNQITLLKVGSIVNNNFKFQKINSYLNLYDLFLLLSIFITENIFCVFVFYSKFDNPTLFVLLIFIFHYLFFLIGFKMGNKIVSKIDNNSSFLAGVIFVFLSLFN